MRGAEVAQSEVLTFMDSHCEVSEGWLQPLLTTIKQVRVCVCVLGGGGGEPDEDVCVRHSSATKSNSCCQTVITVI